MADRYDPPENIPIRPRLTVEESEAFRQIHHDHNQRIYAFAVRILGGDSDVAADVTQETFLRLWRNYHAYREQGTLSSYLFRIAYNLCLDTRRSRRPQADLDDCAGVADTASDVEDAVVAASLSDAVRKAIARLPEGQRAVFVLSHYEQLSYREIAEALNCPIGTVASRKYLAVEALRKSLRHWISDKD